MVAIKDKRFLRSTPQNVKLEIVGKVQDELVNCGKRHRIIAGGRGKGASWSISRILLARGMVRKRFILCVREIQKSIEYSVKKLLDDTIIRCGLQGFYKSLNYEIRGANKTKFVFHGLQDFNADTIQSMEDVDDAWVAEAQTISRRSINIFRPTIRKDGSVIWWDFNQRYETDPIYVDYILNNDPNAYVLLLNWKDNPWFTDSLIMEKDADYQRNEEEAEHIWEGKLRYMGDKYVCPSELVDIAINNSVQQLEPPIVVGADIAHQGGDEIIYYKRFGKKVIDKYISKKQDTIKTVSDLKAFIGDRSVITNIDNGDIGKAVADYLEKDKYIVNRINFGGSPVDKEHYEDCVTEMYFQLRDILDQVDIPNDEQLRNQLIQRKYSYLGSKRGYEVMKIESKDEYKEHAVGINKSPDRADALVLCFYNRGLSSVIAMPKHNIF